MGDYMDGVQLKCSKCGCEGNCNLLRKEISMLKTFLNLEEKKSDELRKLLDETVDEWFVEK
tara:strand:- start:539 stop:721 length:183 start_codon:yes stop_codon:yes gene_type:complete